MLARAAAAFSTRSVSSAWSWSATRWAARCPGVRPPRTRALGAPCSSRRRAAMQNQPLPGRSCSSPATVRENRGGSCTCSPTICVSACRHACGSARSSVPLAFDRHARTPLPTLMVIGTRRPAHAAPRVYGRSAAGAVDLTFAVIQGAAHAINFSHPGELAHVIDCWLDGEKSPTIRRSQASHRSWRSGAGTRDTCRTGRPMAAADFGHHRGLEGTVDSVTTVLLTAILLVAVMFIVVVAAIALAARAHSRRQLADARAQARHWIERLGGEVVALDAAAVRSERRAALRDWRKLPNDFLRPAPSWRPRGPAGSAASHRTAPLRACTTCGRRAGHLAARPAPGVPGLGVGGTIRAALADGHWSVPGLVDAVLADTRARARQLPAGGSERSGRFPHQEHQWARPQVVRR